MSFGFQLLSTSGKVICDSTNFNVGLVANGGLSVLTSGSTVTYEDKGSPPVIFVQHNGNASYCCIQSITNTTATFFLFTDYTGGGSVYREPMTGTIAYAILRSFKDIPPSSGYGMQVFNANSQLVYDSNYYIPNVIGTVDNIGINTPSEYDRQPVSSVALPTGSAWSSATNYNIRTLASYGGVTYISITNNVNKNPSTYVGVDWIVFGAPWVWANPFVGIRGYSYYYGGPTRPLYDAFRTNGAFLQRTVAPMYYGGPSSNALWAQPVSTLVVPS